MASTKVDMDGSVISNHSTTDDVEANGGALNRREMLVKRKSVTMEYFMETRHLDDQTREMLLQYDKDGNGVFSKDEIVAIILDLREKMEANNILSESNRMLKRLLCGAVLFSVFFLTALFGLSYTVAVLTAKTDVAADGSLVASGTGIIVATDSRANVLPVYSDEAGRKCFSEEEKNEIMSEVFSGKNVLLQDNDVNGTQSMMQLSANGANVVNNQPCFPTGEGSFFCFFADVEECSGRRQLSQSVPRLLKGTSPTAAPTVRGGGGNGGETCQDCQTDKSGVTTCGSCSGNGAPCTTGKCRKLSSGRISLHERRLNAVTN